MKLARFALAVASACLAIPGYAVICAARKALAVDEEEGLTLDARGIPTHACPSCGHTFFRIVANFEDYEISFYGLEGECDECGTLVTIPTPVDAPDFSA